MKKLIMIALMVAGAIAADAQKDSRYERRGYENRDDDSRDYEKNRDDRLKENDRRTYENRDFENSRFESRGYDNRDNGRRDNDSRWNDRGRNDNYGSWRRYEGYERWDNNGRYDHSRDRRYNSRWGYSQRFSNPIDDMQRDIRREIEWGIRRGSLTYNESRRLIRELNRIEYREDRYFRDGYLSQWEFEDLARDLYQLDREVSRQRRDWDRRW